jgi:hypothetical protein
MKLIVSTALYNCAAEAEEEVGTNSQTGLIRHLRVELCNDMGRLTSTKSWQAFYTPCISSS